MAKRILIIQGHPDSQAIHFGHALADAYAAGARDAGHDVRRIAVATIDFPVLRSKEDWDTQACPPSLLPAQQDIAWADHIVIFFPLWLGSMPALLKAFLEQVFRPGFAVQTEQSGRLWKKLLDGKSGRVVVSMGMPALVYRWFYRAHSVKSLERNILAFAGIAPVRTSVIGMVEGAAARREKWLARMSDLGTAAR